MIDIRVGDRVYMFQGDKDQIEYAVVLWVGHLPPKHVGPSTGLMAGIQFDNPVGKGNGSLGPVQYFQARNGHAAFVPASMLHRVNADLSLFSSTYAPNHNNNDVAIHETPRRPMSNISNEMPRSTAASSFESGYRNFDGTDFSGVFRNGAISASSSLAFTGNKSPAKPTKGSQLATPGPSFRPPVATAFSPSSNAAYSNFGAGGGYPNSSAGSSYGNTSSTPSSTTSSLSRFAGGRKDSEEDLVFESDEELDEALKPKDGNVNGLIQKMTDLRLPSASVERLAKPIVTKPAAKVGTNPTSTTAATAGAKKQKPVNDNVKKAQGDTKGVSVINAKSVTPSAVPAPMRTPSPPITEAPTASTEWSVVASKIRSAPKQVRDQMKPPEKKAVVAVKPKSKMEKLLEDNPKYKSTLCSWYVQGARCPNGNECHFAHGEAELRSTPRPKYKYKTQVCSYYAAGHCGNGSACHFAHGLADLQKKA